MPKPEHWKVSDKLKQRIRSWPDRNKLEREDSGRHLRLDSGLVRNIATEPNGWCSRRTSKLKHVSIR